MILSSKSTTAKAQYSLIRIVEKSEEDVYRSYSTVFLVKDIAKSFMTYFLILFNILRFEC